MRFDFIGDTKLIEWNSFEKPAQNASQTIFRRGDDGTTGPTIEYGYDSNVQYDYVVVGSGAGYDQSEFDQLRHSINIISVEVRSRPVLPLLATKSSSLRPEAMPAMISHHRYLR